MWPPRSCSHIIITKSLCGGGGGKVELQNSFRNTRYTATLRRLNAISPVYSRLLSLRSVTCWLLVWAATQSVWSHDRLLTGCYWFFFCLFCLVFFVCFFKYLFLELFFVQIKRDISHSFPSCCYPNYLLFVPHYVCVRAQMLGRGLDRNITQKDIGLKPTTFFLKVQLAQTMTTWSKTQFKATIQ